tara:strand:- start:1267 stop:2379 length:1113 start_codon:yes stop_codon:yes gene_type:complete
MFQHLTLAVRDRVIKELRDFWSDHPRYPDFAQNIQGKYSFDERPQFGMVVRTGGANNVVLSPDNFIGTVEGYVSLARVPDKPYSGSIEWVREDIHGAPKNSGVYIFTVYEAEGADPASRQHDVYFQRYRRVVENNLMFSSDTEIMLAGEPIENSLRLIEEPSGRSLGSSEFILQGSTITLLEAVPRGLKVRALYTEKMEQQGPFRVKPATAYRKIIEGVNIVFGRRLRAGDSMAVIVAESREEIAHEYGGRWDVSVDIDLITRDVHSQADIADQTAVWLWATLRPKLANLGLDISDVSLGGEAEEVYDDNGDDYFYTASMSFSMQVDWFIHFPLVIPIQSIFERGILLEPLSQPITGIGNRSADFIQRLL